LVPCTVLHYIWLYLNEPITLVPCTVLPYILAVPERPTGGIS
jgi:hypothetical protein